MTKDPVTCVRRRSLVLGAASAPLAVIAGCGGGSDADTLALSGTGTSSSPAGAQQSLPIVPLDEGVLDASGVRTFSLVAQRGSSQILGGVSTSTLGYNGAMLGPALRLRTGERTAIRVLNRLDEPTSAHWHGLFVPADADGGPHQAIAAGATWQASFEVANPASTCWFHPHVHGTTGRQVVSGLAGLLIVDDPASRPSTLPASWGIDDLALVLQDKRFTPDGQIDYALTGSDRLNGYFGDRLLVNGVVEPVWRAPRQWVRLRLLNGCNARPLTLRLNNALSMLQVANEGGLLEVPAPRSAVTLFPGERAEVLVDLNQVANGDDVRLLASTPASGMGMGMGMGTGGVSAAAEVTALTMRVALPKQPGAIESPPASLPAPPSIQPLAGATVRRFNLDGGMMGSAWTINGRLFDIGRIDLAVPAAAVEVWQFTNMTMMAHPMHVHGVRMTMLSRGGAGPAAQERGPRDTFAVEPMQTVSVAVQTAAQPSPSPLMLHCHVLEHEDAGMMGQFITV